MYVPVHYFSLFCRSPALFMNPLLFSNSKRFHLVKCFSHWTQSSAGYDGINSERRHSIMPLHERKLFTRNSKDWLLSEILTSCIRGICLYDCMLWNRKNKVRGEFGILIQWMMICVTMTPLLMGHCRMPGVVLLPVYTNIHCILEYIQVYAYLAIVHE